MDGSISNFGRQRVFAVDSDGVLMTSVFVGKDMMRENVLASEGL